MQIDTQEIIDEVTRLLSKAFEEVAIGSPEKGEAYIEMALDELKRLKLR